LCKYSYLYLLFKVSRAATFRRIFISRHVIVYPGTAQSFARMNHEPVLERVPSANKYCTRADAYELHRANPKPCRLNAPTGRRKCIYSGDCLYDNIETRITKLMVKENLRNRGCVLVGIPQLIMMRHTLSCKKFIANRICCTR